MTFPVLIETYEGVVTATLVGIEQQIELGELLSLNIERVGVSSLQGKYANDPTLREICTEAYTLRDAEPVE